jgi:hypothetical protein
MDRDPGFRFVDEIIAWKNSRTATGDTYNRGTMKRSPTGRSAPAARFLFLGGVRH